MTAIKGANLALRFLLELCALGALGYWGFRVGRGSALAVVLGLGAPLLMAVVWGLFVAPRATWPLPAPATFVLGLGILCLAAVCLAAAGDPLLGWIMGATVVLNAALLAAWDQ